MGKHDSNREEGEEHSSHGKRGVPIGHDQDRGGDEQEGYFLAIEERHVAEERRESDEVDGGEQRQPRRRVAPGEPVDEHGTEGEEHLKKYLVHVWISEAGDLAQHRRQDRDAQAGVVGILKPAHAPVAVGQGQLEHVVFALDIVTGRVPAAHRGHEQERQADAVDRRGDRPGAQRVPPYQEQDQNDPSCQEHGERNDAAGSVVESYGSGHRGDDGEDRKGDDGLVAARQRR